MSEMKATIIREKSSEKQTLGVFILYKDGKQIFSCKTLELPWLNNQQQISCIPTGTYNVVGRESPKYKKHFHVQDIVGRSWVLIHHGNYYSDIKGCILVGAAHIDINKDGYRDVSASRVTLDKIVALAPEGFTLTIK